jgi:hypothetical protein
VRIAYLILAHNNPVHLQRLVERLTSEDVDFYVHIDRKSDLAGFAGVRHPRLQFCGQRVDCAWGDISLVDATLALVREALGKAAPYDYYVLLSGACYPLQPVEYIADFFQRRQGTEFIEAFSLPNATYGKPVERLTHYWIRKSRPLLGMKWRLQRLLNKTLPARNYQRGLLGAQPTVGSQWWALGDAALRCICSFIDDHPDFYDFCKHVDCPDELVFQTILWNSPFRDRLSHSLTYTDWLPNKSGPEDIGANYLPVLSAALVLDSERNNCPGEKREVLFARKFSDASGVVLKAIDAAIEKKKAAYAADDRVTDSRSD